MKVKNLFLGSLACLAFAACSNDDDPVVNTGAQSESHTYMLVNIATPTGTRAVYDTNSDSTNEFEDGSESENAIKNALFIFFNDANNVTEVVYPDNLSYKDNNTNSESPYVERITKAVLALKNPEAQPSSVLAVVNYPEGWSATGTDASEISEGVSYSDVLAKIKDCSNTTNFVLSNSSFNGEARTKIDPTKHLFTSSGSMPTEDELEKNAVDIYVERVLARVDVQYNTNVTAENIITPNINSTSDSDKDIISYRVPTATVSEDGTLSVTWEDKSIKIVSEVENLHLSYTSPVSYVIKNEPSSPTDWSTSFTWQDPDNMRSYWAKSVASTDFGSDTWGFNKYGATSPTAVSDVANSSTNEYQFYCQENTSSLKTANSTATKLVITAKHEIQTATDSDGSISWTKADEQDLVRYMTYYYLASDFKYVVNNVLKDYYYVASTNGENNTYSNDWSKWITLTRKNTSSKDKAYVVIPTVLETVGSGENASSLATAIYTKSATTEDPWEEVKSANGENETTISTTAGVKAYLEAAITKAMTTDIWCWQDGKAYYYVDIEHLSHSADAPCYAVVRNHIYQLNLASIKGLGTPVFWPDTDNDGTSDDDDDEEIEPEKPSDEAFYVSCRLNVLKWRLVQNQDVNIGW